MDSSISDDPFAPEGVAGEQETVFNEARWRLVGATDEEIETLREQFDGYTEEEQAVEAQRVRQSSNTALLAELRGEQTDAAPAEPVTDVNDPGAVTSDEGQQGGEVQVAEAQPGEPTKVEVPTGSIAVVEEWVGADAGRARAAIEAEQAASKPRSSLVEKLTKIAGATG